VELKKGENKEKKGRDKKEEGPDPGSGVLPILTIPFKFGTLYSRGSFGRDP
jgi:hypothetical protein